VHEPDLFCDNSQNDTHADEKWALCRDDQESRSLFSVEQIFQVSSGSDMRMDNSKISEIWPFRNRTKKDFLNRRKTKRCQIAGLCWTVKSSRTAICILFIIISHIPKIS
jgi:hypothetical protein